MVQLISSSFRISLMGSRSDGPTHSSMCTPLRTINDSLSHRRRYMKLRTEGLNDLVLQRLWFQVYQGVLKKILWVLPTRHPSRPYTAELERRFKDAQAVFMQSHPAEVFQEDLPEKIQDIWDSLTEKPENMPESSGDLLLQSLSWTIVPHHVLFSSHLFSDCEVSHWRKGRKKTCSPKAEKKQAESSCP
uniref:Interleukin 34 n=1 Tax=Maylandia zebra TaxID=106582 RepID=A0A3P9BXW1_9CICH